MEWQHLMVVAVVVGLVACRGSGEKSAKAARCQVRDLEGDVSSVCHLGGPPTIFPPDCTSQTGTSLVINSLVLATKPGCTGRRCCQASSKDRLYSVPCLAELEPSTALTSLERAVLVGCSGHPNCSVAQVSPISLPGLGSSAYLKITSSCVQATPANTMNFCINRTLQANTVFLRYRRSVPANFTANFECTCHVESAGNTTARALAVRQREAGSWLAFVGRTDQSVIERKLRAFDTFYGEKTDVFTNKQFAITLGPLQSGSEPLVWLKFSGSSGPVRVKCRPPVVTTKEFSHGSSSSGAPFSVTGVVVGVVVALILLLGLALVCISRSRRHDKAYNCRENEEKIVVVPMNAEDGSEDVPETTGLKETDPIIYGRTALAPPSSKPPRRPDITYDLPLYGITELYSQVAAASAFVPKTEVCEGTYAVPNGGALCSPPPSESGDVSPSSCSVDCQSSCEASVDAMTPSSEVV